MKKLILILLLFTACSKNSDQVFPSTEGRWDFSNSTTSGIFYITADKVDPKKGSFSVLGKQYVIGYADKTVSTISLFDAATANGVVFIGVVLGDPNKIEYTSYYYVQNSNVSKTFNEHGLILR